MNNQLITYVLIGAVALLGILVVAYLIIRKNDKKNKYMKQLQEGTKTSTSKTICNLLKNTFYKKILV